MSAYLARTFHMSMTSAQIVTWLGLVCIILLIVSGGRILHKAGDRWWKILIPIYGIYCLYKAADSTGLFWGTIGLSVATTIITRLVASSLARSTFPWEAPNMTGIYVINIISGVIGLIISWVFCVRMADVFGKGKGFAAGLFLLPIIFYMILAFGNARHGRYFSSANPITTPVDGWSCMYCGGMNPLERSACKQCGRVR